MSDTLDTRAGRLAAALDGLLRSSVDVEAVAVISFDGLTMASALPDHMDEDHVGAMSAALLSLGEHASEGLARGPLQQVFIEGEHGYVFLMSARDQAVLTAIVRSNARIGFVLFEMRRAAEQIGRALEPPAEPPAEAVAAWHDEHAASDGAALDETRAALDEPVDDVPVVEHDLSVDDHDDSAAHAG